MLDVVTSMGSNFEMVVQRGVDFPKSGGMYFPAKANYHEFTEAAELQKHHDEERRDENWQMKESRSSQCQTDKRDSSSSETYKSQDLSTKAYNQLCTNPVKDLKISEERRSLKSIEEKEQVEAFTKYKNKNVDPTIKAGNRLYTQAMEQLRRHEARRTAALEESENSTKNAGKSLCEARETKMLKAGNRLYQEALAQLKRLEMRRMEAAKAPSTKLEKATRSPHGLYSSTTMEKTGNRLYQEALAHFKRRERRRIEATRSKSSKLELATRSQTLEDGSVGGIHRCCRLYDLSYEMQMLGKQRRTSIEEEKARAKAKQIHEIKILPRYKSCDMYNRSIARLIRKKIKLAELANKFESW